jgi:hypothetical protein
MGASMYATRWRAPSGRRRSLCAADGCRHDDVIVEPMPCNRSCSNDGECAPFVLDYSRDCRRAGHDASTNRRGTRHVNPLPAKKIPAQIRSLCRAYTGEAVRSLAAAIMRQANAPPSPRIQAIAILLDRGWGKPQQTHTGEHDKDLRITIRNIAEGKE